MWTIYRSDSDPVTGFKYEDDARRHVQRMSVHVERLGIYSWAIEDLPGHYVTARIQHTPQKRTRR